MFLNGHWLASCRRHRTEESRVPLAGDACAFVPLVVLEARCTKYRCVACNNKEKGKALALLWYINVDVLMGRAFGGEPAFARVKSSERRVKIATAQKFKFGLHIIEITAPLVSQKIKLPHHCI